MANLIMKYFVLKPAGTDKYAYASRNAMLAYAEALQQNAETDEDNELAQELIQWSTTERNNANG